MKILYDSQVFDWQTVGGISRYFYELLSSFETRDDIEYSLPIIYSNNVYLKQLGVLGQSIQPITEPKNSYQEFFWGKEFRLKPKLYTLKNKIFPEQVSLNPTKQNRELVIKELRSGNFDIFHPTYYDPYFLEHIGDKPFVLTVYDLIHQIFPEFLLYESTDKNRELLTKATKIIAISESTKRDLVHLFNIDENKIAVTHLANSLGNFRSDIEDEFKRKIPGRYLLYVGSRGGYKNFLFFAQVMASIFEKEEDLYVVCTGSTFTEGEKFFFHKIGFQERFVQVFVDDNELRYLYENAEAFVFPSQYEGFGLPVLESMSCGCPALISASSSLIEIGEDAAVYFDPKSPSSMLAAIKSVLSDKRLRKEKIEKGHEQVKKFSWQKMFAQTVDVYNQVVVN